MSKMRFRVKALALGLTTGPILFQIGCGVTSQELQTVLSTSVQTLINGVLGIVVANFADVMVGV